MPKQFYIFIAIMQGFILAIHWFIYQTFLSYFYPRPQTALLLFASLLILSVSFIILSIIAYNNYKLIVRALYTLSAYWMGIVYFLLWAALVCILFFGRFGINAAPQKFAAIVFGAALLAAIYAIINSKIIRVTAISVKFPGLPEQWKNKTAVFISDLHLGQIQNYNFAKRVRRKIEKINPAVVFIGGDLFDGLALDQKRAITPLAALAKNIPSYFISGNHERFEKKEKFLGTIRESGIKILDNQIVNLDGLQIIGVDFHDTESQENFKKVLEAMHFDKSLPTILLKHVPSDLKFAEQLGINFTISGHTHNGQVWPLGYFAKWIYGYNYGRYKLGNMDIYVSSGVGTWGPPLRFGTRAEIVKINFE